MAQKPKKIKGGPGDDVLTGGPGNDDIDGKAGFDTVLYGGAFLEYRITRGKHEFVLSDIRPGAPEGTDTLRNVEALQFSDRIIYLDGRNNAPHALADSALGTEDTPLVMPAASLLANDGDFDGDAISLAGVQGAVNGTVALDGAGNVVFMPSADFNGTASFTYRVKDATLTSSPATVTVNVAPVNDAPAANPDTLAASEDTPVIYAAAQLLDNDTDVDDAALAIGSVTSSTGGTVALNGDGTVRFTPAAHFNGLATFSYTARDGALDSNTASVTIIVAAVNDTPTLAFSPLQVTIEETEDVQVLTSALLLSAVGASDIDGDELRIFNFRLFGPEGEVDPEDLPPGVVLQFAADGSFSLFSFDPGDFSELTLGESQQIRLEFDVVDGQGGSVHAVAELTIVGVAEVTGPASIGEPPLRDVTEDLDVVAGNLSVSGVISITDPDPGQSSFSTPVVAAAGNKGILTLLPHGGYSYIVENGAVQYLGTGDAKVDSFTISAIDGTTRQVHFTVHGVNDRVVIPHQPMNPSFEQIGSPVPFGGTLSLAGGSTLLNGWTVIGAGIDFARNGYQGSQASDGSAYIDLAGSTQSGSYAGGVRQVVGTLPELRYFVLFDMSGNPDGGAVETIRVTGGSDSQVYSFDTAGRNWMDLGWREEQFIFNSSGNNTPLSFESLTGDFMGPLLDNVRLTPIHRIDETVGTPASPANPGFAHIGAVVPPGGTLALAGGSSVLNGWTVTGAGIDFVRNGYQGSQGSDGGAYVDLSGSTLSGSYAGGVRQSIDTVPGARYRVQFDLSGNPDGGSVETVRVSDGTTVQDYAFDTAGRSWTNLGWREEAFIFTASSASTPLSFASLTGDFMGPLLDNVRVSPMIGGTIGFHDADGSDDGDHGLGVAFVGDPLARLGDLTAFIASDTTDGMGGLVRWDYSVDPRAIEFLSGGERRLEKYRLTVDDGHFGADASQYVLVDLVGTNDRPTIEGATSFAFTIEAIAGTPGDPTINLAGGFPFSDVDRNDVHSVTAVLNTALSSGGAPLGRLTSTLEDPTGGFGQGGLARWDYEIERDVVNALEFGDVLHDAFDIVIADNAGESVTGQVIITLSNVMADLLLEPAAG